MTPGRWYRLALVGLVVHLANAYLIGTVENIWPPRVHDPMWRIVFGIQTLNGAGLLLTATTLIVLLAFLTNSKLFSAVGSLVAAAGAVGMLVAFVAVGLDYLQIRRGIPEKSRIGWDLSTMSPSVAGLILAVAFLFLAAAAINVYRRLAEAAARSSPQPGSPLVVRR
jgi:hypothetical protein